MNTSVGPPILDIQKEDNSKFKFINIFKFLNIFNLLLYLFKK